jgi:hypothetical protein
MFFVENHIEKCISLIFYSLSYEILYLCKCCTRKNVFFQTVVL